MFVVIPFVQWNVADWQCSTLIGLSQAGENGPHEVTKTRCFSLGFCGNFLHLGGSVSWAGRSGDLTIWTGFQIQVCCNMSEYVICKCNSVHIPLRRIIGASLRVHVLLDGSDLRVPSRQDSFYIALMFAWLGLCLKCFHVSLVIALISFPLFVALILFSTCFRTAIQLMCHFGVCSHLRLFARRIWPRCNGPARAEGVHTCQHGFRLAVYFGWFWSFSVASGVDCKALWVAQQI